MQHEDGGETFTAPRGELYGGFQGNGIAVRVTGAG